MFGMLWKRPTARGAILSFIGGFISYLILVQVTDRFELYTGGEILVCCLIYFGEGYLSRRTPEKEQEVQDLFARLGS
jgi:Na+/proline symporter